MSDYNFDLRPLIFVCIALGFAVWGLWELVDWLFIDEVIRSSSRLTPSLELVVKDNVVDTIYVYTKP